MSSPIRYAEDVPYAVLKYAPRWARNRAETVLPPAPSLPALLPSWRIDNTRASFGGDRAMIHLPLLLTLNPDEVPEPPTEPTRSLMPLALRFCAVGSAAAFVAWAIFSPPGTRKATPTVSASSAPSAASGRAMDSTTAAAARPRLPDHLAEGGEPPRQAALEPVPPAPPVPQVVTKQADASPVSSPQSTPLQTASASVHLDSDEIATLIGRGKDFLAHGDFISARLLLRRAAEAGSASAALMLGATFDPFVPKTIIGAVPDIAQARQWYEKAVMLGSKAASNQLANLAKMGP